MYRTCTVRRPIGPVNNLGSPPLIKGVDYLDKVQGCVSDSSQRCPEGYVGFMSAAQDFKLELCTKTDTCHRKGPDFTVEPTKYGTYTVPGVSADQLVACLELNDMACPPQFPKRINMNNLTACSM
jgi:hypothetical protein